MDFMDGSPLPQNRTFQDLYGKADRKDNYGVTKEYDDLYKMLQMGMQYPEQRMDLLEIFKRLKAQQMDTELNNVSVGRMMEENNRRNLEQRYLPAREEWDMGKFFNFTGRKM